MFVADNSCCRFQLYYSWLHLACNVATFVTLCPFHQTNIIPSSKLKLFWHLPPVTARMIKKTVWILEEVDYSNLNCNRRGNGANTRRVHQEDLGPFKHPDLSRLDSPLHTSSSFSCPTETHTNPTVI